VLEVKGMKRRKFCVSVIASRFESPVSVAVWLRDTIKKPEKTKFLPEALAEARLSFEKNAVIVTALQGKRSKKNWLDRFKSITKYSWAEYLIERIEEHAKRNGFDKIKIVVPETLPYYKEPYIPLTVGLYKGTTPEKIRASMKRLYDGVAKKMGYTKKGDYFIKEL
jgi:hypothetical protein